MRGTTGILSAAVLFGFASTAMAQEAVNDPSVGGQLNQCWGQVASQVAKLSDDSVTGGGMGAHSRSTHAANNVGDFAINGFRNRDLQGKLYAAAMPRKPSGERIGSHA